MTVSTIDRISTGSLVLAHLGDTGTALLAPFLERRTVARGERLRAHGARAEVWFPETLVATMNERLSDGSVADVGIIGREGVVGWPTLLGDGHETHGATALLDGGTVMAADAETIRELCDRHDGLRRALMAFVQSYTVQMTHSVASARRDPVEVRLARLLLMLHDRIDGEDMAITHVELSASMHIRRASVTDCLHVLEGDGIVRCTRGRLIVRDRPKLRELAATSYGAAEAAYSRSIAPFGRG